MFRSIDSRHIRNLRWPPAMPAALLNQGVELGGQFTSLNGQTTNCQLDPKWAERGVLFGSLAESGAATRRRAAAPFARPNREPWLRQVRRAAGRFLDAAATSSMCPAVW